MILPSVDILMAIWFPNKQWLREQLESLNNQDYSNLRLLIWNDGPASNGCEDIFQECITKFPYLFFQCEFRLGSTGAFAELTNRANADYVAYCDQDDIWETDKIRVLVREIIKKNADMICSDASVIDENGYLISDSVVKVRPHQFFPVKKEISSYLLKRNFVMGCTVLIKSDIAKKSLPFPKHMVHDWWLALYVSLHGCLAVVEKSLIRYRIHAENQTGTLRGIKTKQDYYEKKILLYMKRIRDIYERFKDTEFAAQMIPYMEWAERRIRFFQKSSLRSLYDLLLYQRMDYQTTWFEICMKFMPPAFFRYIVGKIQAGKI